MTNPGYVRFEGEGEYIVNTYIVRICKEIICYTDVKVNAANEENARQLIERKLNNRAYESEMEALLSNPMPGDWKFTDDYIMDPPSVKDGRPLE